MSSQAVVLILGAGPRIGKYVSQAFAAKGYKVALASRSIKKEDDFPNQTNFQWDLSDPFAIPQLFEKVKDAVGLPSVVLYNGEKDPAYATEGNVDKCIAAATVRNEPKDPFSISIEEFINCLRLNTASVFNAAKQSTLAFSQLPDSASRTFIYTGNALNTDMIIAPLMTLGVGKSATAHMIHSASSAYADRGFKFYYADERKEDGSPAFMDISGEAAAQHYVELAEGKEQGPWQQTFVAGKGYQHF